MKNAGMKNAAMKIAICLVFCALAFAADSAKISFSKSFPGSAPAFFSITVDRTGAGTYNESEDPDNAEKLQLEPAAGAQLFEIAERLDYFKKPLESGLKVANMGMKTVRWENGAEKGEAKFNFSVNEDAKALADIFERIADSSRMLLELKRVMRHDKLGVNDAMLRILGAWENKRLLATPQFLPVLDQVAANEAFIHMARDRAARIADGIRAANP